MTISSRPAIVIDETAFFRAARRSIVSALGAILDKMRDATEQGVEDLRDAVTLEEFKLVLDASAEWEQLMMPKVDPGKDTSQ
jgi:hypothetical protein